MKRRLAMSKKLVDVKVQINKFYRTWQAVNHGDCCVTITVYLHKTPTYPSPWNNACHIMVTVARGLPSMVELVYSE